MKSIVREFIESFRLPTTQNGKVVDMDCRTFHSVQRAPRVRIGALIIASTFLTAPALTSRAQQPPPEEPAKEPENPPGTEGAENTKEENIFGDLPLEEQLPDDPDEAAQEELQQRPERPAFRGFRGRDFNGGQDANTNFVVPADGDLVPIAFNGTPIRTLLNTLSEWAGKPVIPASAQVGQMTITMINAQPKPKAEAFALLCVAMNDAGVGVIDYGTHISLIAMTDLTNRGDIPVLAPEDDVLVRTDIGMTASKAYQIKYSKAETINNMLVTLLPQTGTSKITFDADSNQVVVVSSVQTLKVVQRLLDQIDTPSGGLVARTYTLKHSDAETVAKLIVSLYGESQEQNQGGGNFRGGRAFQVQRGGNQGEGEVQTSAKLKVVADKTHNSVTVLAGRETLDQIDSQIKNFWDVPLAEAAFVPRVYELKNSDAIKVRDLLRNLFAEGEASTATFESVDFFGGRFQQDNQQRSGNQEEGVKISPLAGQFSFEVDDQNNRLFVTARSAEYFTALDKLIEKLDTPSEANAPILYKLKYVDAEKAAEVLNALLAPPGSGEGIGATQRELSNVNDISSLSESDTGGTTDGSTASAETITFWWQNTQPQEDERPISPLIGKLRIVPLATQNGLYVLCPPEHRRSVDTIIEQIDQPGRQVLIAATVAEVSVENDLSLGLRWGSGNIFDSPNPDNEIRIVNGIEGTENNILSDLFDTSVLNTNVDLNVALQALAQDTDLRVLSNPRIYTSDNEEANFFDGQDIPFITDSSFTDTGQTNQSFDYKAVGISLSARPHITTDGNVDLRVNLQLSSIVPGQTLFGGFILDRRETTTKVTVKNGQTVVVSGILRQQDSEIKRKVPLLGDIPLLGLLFRSKTTNTQNKELVAFITPIVLDNVADTNDEVQYRIDQLKKMGYEITLPKEIQVPAPSTNGETMSK